MIFLKINLIKVKKMKKLKKYLIIILTMFDVYFFESRKNNHQIYTFYADIVIISPCRVYVI